MTDHHSHIVTFHAVEFDVDLLAVVVLGVQHHWLDSDTDVQVYHLEGGEKHIPHQVAREVLPHHEIHQFFLTVLLHCYVFVLLQEKWILPSKLEEDPLFCFSCKLVQNVLAQIAVVEGKEEGAWDFCLEPFDVDGE